MSHLSIAPGCDSLTATRELSVLHAYITPPNAGFSLRVVQLSPIKAAAQHMRCVWLVGGAEREYNFHIFRRIFFDYWFIKTESQ